MGGEGCTHQDGGGKRQVGWCPLTDGADPPSPPIACGSPTGQMAQGLGEPEMPVVVLHVRVVTVAE